MTDDRDPWTYVPPDACAEMRRYARQGHACTAIAKHLLDDWTAETVRHHVYGRCEHYGNGEEPLSTTGGA